MNDLDALQFTTEHEWVARDGDLATVGITRHAAAALGDVVYLGLPPAGTAVTAGRVCGEIESTKSVSDLYAPVTGEVVEVNEAAVADPAAVNAEPYGAGWLLRIRVDPDAPAELLDHAGYVALIGGAA